MTSQPRLQTIAIHVLPNISQSKGNQTMKFGHLIEYNNINIFLQKLCEKWGRETSFRPLFIFFKKINRRWKQMVCSLISFLLIALNLSHNKSKLYKTLEYWSTDMLNFNFSEIDLGLVSPSAWFLKKNVSHVSLSDWLYFSRYWTICVLQMFVTQAVTS